MEFEEPFIDAAEFLRAEVFVVHPAPDIPIAHEGKGVDGFEEVAIGELGIEEVGRGLRGRPEEAGEGGEREFRGAGVGAEFAGDQLEHLPQVGMRRARAVEGERVQAGDGVEVEVAPPGLEGGLGFIRRMQQSAVLRDEETGARMIAAYSTSRSNAPGVSLGLASFHHTWKLGEGSG